MDRPNKQIQPYALKAGEGWTYRFGIDFTVKRGEVQKGSGAAFIEYATRKREEPPSHTHATEDEMFYVLEGTTTFRCGRKSFDLEKGGCTCISPGGEPGYIMSSEAPIRLITM